MRLSSPLQMFCFTHYNTSLYFLYLLLPIFIFSQRVSKTHRPGALKREKTPDIVLLQVGQRSLLVVGHTSKTLELGLTSHSLTFNLSFLLFFLHITPGLGFLSFFSFLFFFTSLDLFKVWLDFGPIL